MSTDPHAPTPAGPDPDEPTLVTPAVAPADATPEVPAGTAAAGDDWLRPDPAAGTPAPDPLIATPDAFTPPGTPESDGDGPVAAAQAKVADVQETAQATAATAQAKAQELTDRPEVMVGLAFAGGALVSLVLKRFGR